MNVGLVVLLATGAVGGCRTLSGDGSARYDRPAGAAQSSLAPAISAPGSGQPSYEETTAWLQEYVRTTGQTGGVIRGKVVDITSQVTDSRWPCVLWVKINVRPITSGVQPAPAPSQQAHTTGAGGAFAGIGDLLAGIAHGIRVQEAMKPSSGTYLWALSRANVGRINIGGTERNCVVASGADDFVLHIEVDKDAQHETGRGSLGVFCLASEEAATRAARAIAHAAELCGAINKPEPF